MYLSRIELDARRRNTVRALAWPCVLHGAVEQCFTGERKRRLWRVDNLKNSVYLLILSEEAPDLNLINDQFGVYSEKNRWETKSYEKLLDRLEKGQSWRFRLRANPVHSVKDGESIGDNSKRGKIYAHITPENQKKWLSERAESHGFLINNGDFNITRSEWINFNKSLDKRGLSIYTADFEGKLNVADADIFRKTLLNGIGRAKAYGCGLLTIMRA